MRISKRKISDFLKDKGVYESIDETLVDILFDVLSILDAVKDDIDTDGIFEIDANTGKKVMNPAVKIHNMMVSEFLAISKKLGLSAFDRKALGMDLQPEDDFDED